MTSSEKTPAFQLLTLITTHKLAERATEIFGEVAIPIQYRMSAEGTASSEIMDMLGLGSIDKTVLTGIIPKSLSESMLDKLYSELRMDTANSGIAFTITLTGANNLILRMVEQKIEENTPQGDRKEENTVTEAKYVLIAAVVNRGFSSDVMDAARAVGAGGGTIIHSHRIGNEEVAGFWGLSHQEEKETVLIIASLENKVNIMKEISEKCGMHSNAKGVVLSLPIDSVIGFSSR
ncbi:MAG: hypothetical protein IJ391_01595 [Clostridia bacterium]|nr:hypothetical protein [Clostridia bacterium]